MKVLILGHARHGKDTAAELFGLKMISSSYAALNEFLFDELQEYMSMRGLGQYRDPDHAYADRIFERDFWFTRIRDYNIPDATKLARAILKHSDIYVGMRNNAEFQACKEAKLFDKIYWVDASKRKPLEPRSSFDIDFDPEIMTIIDNNGTEDQLRETVKQLSLEIQSGSE